MTKEFENLFSLKDKVIIITGASGLLGERHAEAVAAFGANPVLLDLSQKKVENIAVKLNKKFNVNAVGFEVDITSEKQIKDSVRLILNQFGKIDCLINNAANNPKVEDNSVANFSRLENFPLDIWNKDLAVGLTGSFLCAKHFGNEISKNLNGGSIINISSDLGLISPDQRLYMRDHLRNEYQPVKPVTYSVIKTGLIGLTRYLSTYWADKNVRCNALCPGGVENGQSEDFINEVSSRIPMNRLAKVDEYQSTIVWMISDASCYLNGAILPVDGGRTSW